MKFPTRNSTRLTPLAAALALLLSPALAVASTHAAGHDKQQTMTEKRAMPSSVDAMTLAVKDAFREGQIWATYAANPKLDSFDLSVDVAGDKATLTGKVDSPVDKKLAERIALHTDGVTRVDNQIKVDPTLVVTVLNVEPTFADSVADATLESMIESKLLWNQNTDGLDIDVQVLAGVVTLSGPADTIHSKELAGRIAAKTTGTVAVHNLLTVDTVHGQVAIAEAGEGDNALSDTWIAAKVDATLLYTSGVDGTDIDVKADDGVVTLQGKVDSRYEKELAIELAQGIRGVKRVDASGLELTAMSKSVSKR